MTEEDKPGRGLSLLIVEDNPFQRTLAARLLEELGCSRVLTASDGQDALDTLNRLPAPVHIVLSDLDMPGMDGVAFLRQLASNRLTEAIAVVSAMEPTLVHTVEEMAGKHGLWVLAGATKPVTHDSLRRLIGQYRRKEGGRLAPQPGVSFSRADVARGLKAGEFATWYQPKVRIRDGAWVSSEALVRWQHPDHGLVMPAQFLPVMKEDGLLVQLTWQQMRTIVEDLERWGTSRPELSVAVNLSPCVLQDTSLPCRLAGLLDRHGVPARNLIFEMTENGILDNSASSLETLARLRLKGAALSIDDFGAGFSGLRRLDRIPFSELKIDRHFVHNMNTRAASRTIIESNLEMARRLQITTVAEGVETPEDWKRLSFMGCDLAQGFLIGRPMPAPALLQWEKTWQDRYRSLLAP